MEEFQIWQIWSSNRIGSGLIGIGTILGVWLSMRIAMNTRNNPETNLLTKIISSAFGLVVLAFAWINFTTIANTWIAAARNLSDLKASDIGKGRFIKYFNPPLGKLQKLDISFVTYDNNPYDFNGHDHTLFLQMMSLNQSSKYFV